MRISDWSSDVCSSDLLRKGGGAGCRSIAVVGPPLESLRDHIPFGRFLAARGRLGVFDGGEVALEFGDEIAVGAARQHLGDERADGAQDFGGDRSGARRVGKECVREGRSGGGQYNK